MTASALVIILTQKLDPAEVIEFIDKSTIRLVSLDLHRHG
jgi:hypothetical protein